MGDRDIGELIKESTESKVNTKKTWSSNLIEEFSNVDIFKEKESNSTNFQQASIVLDGCVKMYSARVESVVTEANKLMESVGRTKETEKQKPKEKQVHSTLESNPEAIQIKRKLVTGEDEILEYLLRETKEGDTRGLLMHLLKWNDQQGIRVLHGQGPTQKETKDTSTAPQSSTENKEISKPQSQLETEALIQNMYLGERKKYVSPMFSQFTPDQSQETVVFPIYAYNISYDTRAVDYVDHLETDRGMEEDIEHLIDQMNQADTEHRSEDNEYIEYPNQQHSSNPETQGPPTMAIPTNSNMRLSISHFGYVKGWERPSHWKLHTKRRAKEKAPKEKVKAQIDFLTTELPPLSLIFEKCEGIGYSPQEISERRKNPNTQPPNYNVQLEDLYRLFIYPGTFYKAHITHVAHSDYHGTTTTSPNEYSEALEEQGPNDMYDQYQLSEDSMPDNTNYPMPENNNMEIETGIQNTHPTIQLSPGQFTGRQTHSAANMLARRLAQNALRRAHKTDIAKIKESLWTEVEKGETEIDKMYTTVKDQQVSVQFYLVSLLHLANEKNLRISANSTIDTLPSIFDLQLTPAVAARGK
ncbi:condensin complex subunit 2 [Nematocida sp. AWRm80]|nr:condensin complex subunit 2 [Nematocida sp. AWRm80]